MRAEEHQGMAENFWISDSEISDLLQTRFAGFDYVDSQHMPAGTIEPWSERVRTAVQTLLTELDPTNRPEQTRQVQSESGPLQVSTPATALRLAAETDALRVAFIEALRQLTDANEIQATAARVLGESLGASRVLYIEVLPGGEEVMVHKHYTNGVAELSGRYRLEDFGRNLIEDHRSGQTVIVPDVASSAKYTSREKAMYRTANIVAHLDVPLIKNGQFVALLAVHQATPRDWTNNEVKWVEEAAEQTWAAVERARAEAALRASEAKYRTLFESIDEGFCICELLFDQSGQPCDYRFLEVNAAFERLTGLEQVVGKTVRELVPNHEAYWFEVYGNVVQTRKSTRFENYAIAMNRWFNVNAFCIGEPQNHQFAALFTNITEAKLLEAERQQAETDRRETAVQLESALAAGAVYTWRWLVPDDRVVVDAALAHLFGVDLSATTVGLSINQFIQRMHEEDRPRVIAAIQRAIETGEEYISEYRVHTATGEERWLAARGRVKYGADGQPIAFPGALADITNRKQAEVSLRESEEKSRNILESITEAFFALDQDWRFTYVNQAAEVLLDRLPRDLLGKNLWEEFPGLAGSDFEPMCWGAMHERVFSSITAFYPDHDRWYEARSYPATHGITIYFRNVTEQLQAAEALRLSEAQFRRIFECNMIGMGTWARSGGITNANDALLNLIGYTREGLNSGRINWQEITAPEHAERDQQALAEIAIQGVCTSYEKDYIHAQGHRVPILIGAAGFVDTSEAGFFFAVDLTDRKQIEAALKARNERLNLLSEVANDLLLEEDPKASLAHLFTKVSAHLGLEVFLNYLFEANQHHLRLHAHSGISDEIATSASVVELGQAVCGYTCQQRQPTIVENALDSDHPLALPVKSVGICAYASHPLIVGDRVLGTLGLGTRTRDRFTPDELDLMQAVTHQVAAALERSRLVGELQRRAEDLEQTNRIKDEFLAVLSHELRSPLNPILGWTRLLRTGKLDPVRQTEALATIERNAKLQSQLIEDLLDISRIMQGKLSLSVAPVNLPFVISAAVETVSLAASAKQIHITLDLDSEVAPISGDATRLQQVVWNLLTNAVKFTPNGKQVTIELRQLNQMAQIRVIDTGNGIAPQFLPYVFEYFRQEDGSTTRRFGGLGLGLAIVKQIVELHGGTVKAESRGEDQGATFTVQLPTLPQVIPAVPEPMQAEADSEMRLKNVKILLVDDETDTREFQAFLLEQNGATVIAADSGLAALQALEQFLPDVIVSDVGMAEIDGYMLIREIRSRPATQGGTIPAIALTAYAAELDQKRVLQAGFQMHLTKPLEPEQFFSTIVNLLQDSKLT